MKVDILPSKAEGKVVVPPSKSMAHRALICGAFSENSIIDNVDFSDDIKATIGCLKKLGAKVEIDENRVRIGGLNAYKVKANTVIDCLESGSTLRFLLPFCMSCGKKVTLKGTKRLFERNLTVYEKIAKQHDVLFEKK